MVSALSTADLVKQPAVNREENITKLLKYAGDEALIQEPDSFVKTVKDNLKTSMIFEGIPLFNLLHRNKKYGGKFINSGMQALGEKNKQALVNIIKGEGKFSERIGNFINTANESRETFAQIKSFVKSQAKAMKLNKKSIEKSLEAAANPNNSKLAKAAEKAAEKHSKALDKVFNNASSFAEKAAESGTKTAGKFGKFGSFMKSSGAGIMLVFSGGFELATEVYPTFKELGKEKGIKQLAKSAVKVVGDTAGFIAGEQIGTSVGTAIGTAICPGIGTAIGAVIGFTGGLVGSWAAGKVTKAITGPSEREIVKNEQEQMEINETMFNDDKFNELKNEVENKIQEEYELNNGHYTENGKIALQTLKELNEPAY